MKRNIFICFYDLFAWKEQDNLSFEFLLNFIFHLSNGHPFRIFNSLLLTSCDICGLNTTRSTTSKPQYQVQCWFFLNIVINEHSSILKLRSCEYESLLIRWNSLLVLNLLFYSFHYIIRWYIQCNGFSSKSLDKDLHARIEICSTKSCYLLK